MTDPATFTSPRATRIRLKKAEKIIPHPFDRILEQTDAPGPD